MRLEYYLGLAFGGVVLAWLGVTAFVIASRALHDLGRRWVHAAEGLAADQDFEAHGLAERERVLADVLGRLRRREILRIAGDASTPSQLAVEFARFAVAHWPRRILRHAHGHRGELTLWRRVAALRILARAGEPSALPLLERAIVHGSRQLSEASVAVLGTLADRRAAEALIGVLRERRVPPSRAATFLDRFPLDVPELIGPLLRDPDPEMRFWGATLAARYSESPTLAAELTRLARDPHPDVRAAAVESLGSVGGGECVTAATELLTDPVWYVRAHAVRALGVLGTESAAPAIARLFADTSWWVRFAAKEALERMGPEIAHAVIPSLRHGDEFARNCAAEVLQNVGVVDAVVAEAAAAPEREDSVALARRIFSAGGPALAAAAVARADPGARGFVARELSPKGGPAS